jgi:hypothetical protein
MKLSDKIWITRKVRIIAEQRLLKWSMISQVFMIFFSLIMVFCSIWNFTQQNTYSDSVLLCGSIAILAISIFLTSQRFSERALAMRNCYIRLDELYTYTLNIEESKDSKSMQEVIKRYNDILLNVENHSEYDYLNLRFSLRKQKNTTLPEFTKLDYCDFLLETFIRIISIIFLFLVPLVLPLILILSYNH